MSSKKSKPKISYELEARFLIFLILSGSMYFIASSIGSGWVLFIAASVLACALLAFIFPRLILAAIRPAAFAPDKATAGETFQVRVRLDVSKAMSDLARMLILNLVPVANSVFAKRQKTGEPFVIENLTNTASITLTSPPLRRGLHKLPPLSISTSYPLALVWVKAEFPFEESIIVFPKTYDIEGKFLFRLKSSVFVPGDSQSSNAGFASAASRGVRQYVRGDSRRHIHWNLSARHGQLMVKERENEGLPAFDVILDLGANWKDADQFDLGVSAAASLISFGNSSGVHPELFIINKEYKAGCPLPERIVELDQQMIQLACLDYANSANGYEIDRDYSALAHRPRAVVLVAPAGEPTIAISNTRAQRIENSQANNELTRTHSNRVDPRTRSSLFKIKIAAKKAEIADLESKDNEFLVQSEEDLCLL